HFGRSSASFSLRHLLSFLRQTPPPSVRFIFIYYVSARRDLHSFPTRRSSDLSTAPESAVPLGSSTAPSIQAKNPTARPSSRDRQHYRSHLCTPQTIQRCIPAATTYKSWSPASRARSWRCDHDPRG